MSKKYKLKVLQVVSVSFSLRYFIGNQFKVFKEKGVDYTVACSASNDLFNYSKKMGFTPFPVNINRKISLIEDLKSIYKLYRFIRREKFDVVIAHSPKGGLIGMSASFFARCPKRVFFRHGLVFETTDGLKRQLLIFIEKLTARFAHQIVNVSPSIEKKSALLYLNPMSKSIILGRGTCNGINVDKFMPRLISKGNDKRIVGYVGRLSNDKGIPELIEAWKILSRQYDNIELLLVGPFDQRDVLIQETVDFIKSCESINHIGEVQETFSYYNLMDIFVLPSYREGFPTVTLEASSSALPVITTRSTGCIDSIIENHTGMFTDLDSLSIAEKIGFYLNNPNIAIEHGKNGRDFVVNNFSEKLVYNEIESKILK